MAAPSTSAALSPGDTLLRRLGDGVAIGALGGVLFWRQPEILVISMIALYGVGFGALVWAAGWIVQGFLSDPPPT